MNARPDPNLLPAAASTPELTIRGWGLRTARLRHEWCDFLEDPATAIAELRRTRRADLLTFVRDVGETDRATGWHCEPTALAVLTITSYDAWWEQIGKKKRNQIRKARKSGVEVRECVLGPEFARGVEALYNECPVRQGRRFYHYGQTAAEIEEELGSFGDRTILLGAYVDGTLVGFVKLFRAVHALRIVHILAKLAERDKCVMDALIDASVRQTIALGRRHLHYGSWTDRGIGAFRTKHGFERIELPRYFVPLSRRGEWMLRWGLHRPIRARLPDAWLEPLLRWRARWNAWRFNAPREFADA